jgi:GT2 family glycosyltransferase
MSEHPISRHVTKFAVGMTTATRRDSTLHQSLTSLMESGFDKVTVFAEPHAPTSMLNNISGVDIVRRPKTIDILRPGLFPAGEDQKETGRFGCWQNYVQTMADLLVLYPEAEAILIVQDDAVFAKGIREFLEHDLWPSPVTGCVSLYTSRVHERTEAVGCKSRKDFGKMGAVANIMPREVVQKIIDSPRSHSWRGNQNDFSPEDTAWLKKAADTWLGRSIRGIGVRAYSYTPSFSQHVSKYSAVGHGDNSGKRSSSKFIGEEKNVSELFSENNCWPKVRFNLPQGTRRYAKITHKPRIRVSIPAINSPDLTIKCISHLAECNWPLVIDYVDNGSDAGVLEQIEKHGKNFDHIQLECHRFEKNEGFTPAVNLSMKKAIKNKEYFLIMNNDCFVAPSTIERLYRALYLEKDIACVGPLTCDRGHQSLRKPKRLLQSGLTELPSNPKDVVSVSESLRNHTASNETMVAFFCTLFSPESLQSVTHLPVEFTDGLGADDVWCAAARRRKFVCQLVHDAYAHHMHSETFRRTNMDRNKMQQVAMKKIKGS